MSAWETQTVCCYKDRNVRVCVRTCMRVETSANDVKLAQNGLNSRFNLFIEIRPKMEKLQPLLLAHSDNAVAWHT